MYGLGLSKSQNLNNWVTQINKEDIAQMCLQAQNCHFDANCTCFTRHHHIVHISHTRHMGNFYHKITFFTIMVI